MAAFPHKGRVKVEVAFELLTTVANFFVHKAFQQIEMAFSEFQFSFFFQAGDTVVLRGQFMRVRLHKYCNTHTANQQHLALDAISTQIGKIYSSDHTSVLQIGLLAHPSRGPLSLAIHPCVGMILQFRSSMTANGNFSLRMRYWWF